ncbi:maestro heat-like repeat-containing protein family member 2B [Platysternon megacephalum]|uniref:Maestro heat-like repeat-containing protein family member 2B n=1 Tax=Platysternon megacephalum TaxID=55544 RepID=A0A4D9DN82_9SAUR|nr:maestro heat-like repeat-containing protein family member 2B [Platysternon megacephalum]
MKTQNAVTAIYAASSKILPVCSEPVQGNEIELSRGQGGLATGPFPCSRGKRGPSCPDRSAAKREGKLLKQSSEALEEATISLQAEPLETAHIDTSYVINTWQCKKKSLKGQKQKPERTGTQK